MIQLRDDIAYALDKEREWREARKKMDGGSYCEDSAGDYRAAGKIEDLYGELATALVAFERSHGQPKQT